MTLESSIGSAAGFRIALSADDWALARRSRANLLVTGPRAATDQVIVALTPSLRSPIARLKCDRPLRLPAGGGTVILDEVDALASRQQDEVLEWINASFSRPRVISVATTPLYTQVQAGTFEMALYYRLNVLCFEVMGV